VSQYDNPAFDDQDLELDLTPPPVGAQYHPAETEDLLLTLRDLIENARDVPLSASSMISKDEVLALIDDALDSLPEELRAARWLLKEREEFLARTRHEADDIVDQARTRAERMVQRTEVVKAFVVLQPGWEASAQLAAELQDHVKLLIAPYKYPRKLDFVTSLPRTVSGKVSRRLLRQAEFGEI